MQRTCLLIMMSRDPRISAIIDPVLLRDNTISRIRGSSSKPCALIKSTTHPNLPIAVYNYTQDITAWDPLTLAARTLVIEPKTGVVISRSFSKIFNYDEPLAYKPTGDEEAVVVEEKLDRSIISLFWCAGGWHVISKSQFTGPYVDMANEILNQKYCGAKEKLDKDKTYVFELINPSIPIGVKYAEKDMVLLSIVSRDAQEPPVDYDWSRLPFSRPRILDARTVDLDALRKMNPVNEEGFVVKFYPRHCGRPQRVKVKFDSYLALIRAKSHISPAGILKLYTKSRSVIPELDETLVRPHMKSTRAKYIDSLRHMADDMGGDAWLRSVNDTWEMIDELFVRKERELQRLVAVLTKEGYLGNNSREHFRKKQFAERVGRRDVDVGLRQPLHRWFAGASVQDQIRCFVGTLPVPDSWKQEKALGVRKLEATVTRWK